jgi:lipopolysaccharide/colanic/teichoic acid biosynthesis glycosyltransferase
MVKRLFDIFFALGWLVLFTPLMLVVAGLVRLKLGSPVLFIQERPGLRGRPFRMVKFRTMTDERRPRWAAPARRECVSPLSGKFLRASTLDEFPEMWNVLVGDMSVVGPRPLLMRYLPRYDAFQARRMEVKPGVTGWAQVNGRNALSWEQKFAYDVWYVDHRTLWLDLKIVVLTFFKVFARSASTRTKRRRWRFRGNGQKLIRLTGWPVGEKVTFPAILAEVLPERLSPGRSLFHLPFERCGMTRPGAGAVKLTNTLVGGQYMNLISVPKGRRPSVIPREKVSPDRPPKVIDRLQVKVCLGGMMIDRHRGLRRVSCVRPCFRALMIPSRFFRIGRESVMMTGSAKGIHA